MAEPAKNEIYNWQIASSQIVNYKNRIGIKEFKCPYLFGYKKKRN